MTPRGDSGESLTAKLLVAQQSDADEADNGRPDLLLRGLVDRLPKSNAVWSLDDRAKWLRTAASIFDLVYKASDSELRQISIAVAKQDAERIA